MLVTVFVQVKVMFALGMLHGEQMTTGTGHPQPPGPCMIALDGITGGVSRSFG
jgi:hypothetical protein